MYSSGGHVLNAVRPPGVRTRSISVVATAGRGAKMCANWLRTASNSPSRNGRFSASPSFQTMSSTSAIAAFSFAVARSSGVRSRPVTMAAGRRAVIATTPVPHPTSSTLWPGRTPAKPTSLAAGGVVFIASGANSFHPSRCLALNSANGSEVIVSPAAGKPREWITLRAARPRHGGSAPRLPASCPSGGEGDARRQVAEAFQRPGLPRDELKEPTEVVVEELSIFAIRDLLLQIRKQLPDVVEVPACGGVHPGQEAFVRRGCEPAGVLDTMSSHRRDRTAVVREEPRVRPSRPLAVARFRGGVLHPALEELGRLGRGEHPGFPNDPEGDVVRVQVLDVVHQVMEDLPLVVLRDGSVPGIGHRLPDDPRVVGWMLRQHPIDVGHLVPDQSLEQPRPQRPSRHRDAEAPALRRHCVPHDRQPRVHRDLDAVPDVEARLPHPTRGFLERVRRKLVRLATPRAGRFPASRSSLSAHALLIPPPSLGLPISRSNGDEGAQPRAQPARNYFPSRFRRTPRSRPSERCSMRTRSTALANGS